MPKLVWFILAVVLTLGATLGLINGIYGLLIGFYGEYGLEFIDGTFFWIMVAYYVAYKSWKKAGVADKQTEKKE